MRAARSLELTDLLLATAKLAGNPAVVKLAPHFHGAWLKAVKGGDAEAPLMPSVTALKGLLETALALCEAGGIEGHELTTIYNDRRDAGEFATPADLPALLDACTECLLAMVARRAEPTEEEPTE